MTYSLKHKVISWISKNLFDHFEYEVRGGFNKGLRRKGGLAWVPLENWTPEIEFWKQLDLRGKVIYDIGAFHGLLTIYFARQGRSVVAWEPNAANRRRLEENIAINRFTNVTVRPFGLSSQRTTAKMRFDPLAPGTASIDASMAWGGNEETIELRVLDEEEALPAPDFIKVDVEGFELEVLKGARRTLAHHPDLFLEMHGADPADKRRRVEAIVAFLVEAGYGAIEHVETKTAIGLENAAVAAQGHLYVRRGSSR
jgi:FkbM family methyltransferase